MTARSQDREVYVEAHARLHFGVLDLRGDMGRWFGGIGAAAPAPTLCVSARASDSVSVLGEDAGRVREMVDRVQTYFNLAGGVRVTVHRLLPAHVGLGSGTQLALSVAKAIAELNGIAADVGQLSVALGRGDRSAVGTHTFDGGGFVVEGGRTRGSAQVSPLIARLEIPESWWCVVGVPDGPPGVNGPDESAAFADLPDPAEHEVGQVARMVLMSLLPALADRDLATFGRTLTAIQALTGEWFAPAQGGTFAPGPTSELVNSMADWGAVGVGQSSWGPAVYGIAASEDEGRRLGEKVRRALGSAGRVYEGSFPRAGARVWHEQVGDSARPDRPPISADL